MRSETMTSSFTCAFNPKMLRRHSIPVEVVPSLLSQMLADVHVRDDRWNATKVTSA
jgi:hypothetical protein